MNLDATTIGTYLLSAGSGLYSLGTYKLKYLLRFLVKPLPTNKPFHDVIEERGKYLVENLFTKRLDNEIKTFLNLMNIVETGKEIAEFYHAIDSITEKLEHITEYHTDSEITHCNLEVLKSGIPILRNKHFTYVVTKTVLNVTCYEVNGKAKLPHVSGHKLKSKQKIEAFVF